MISAGHMRFLALSSTGKTREDHTEWDFELRRELNRLVDLYLAIRRRIVQEPLKMEDKNGWKRLDLYLLDHLAWALPADLYGLGLQDVRECVFNGVHQVGLREDLGS